MNRDIKELISRYDKELEDQIYTTDIQQVLDISREECRQVGDTEQRALWYALITNAMRAGFMIGYETKLKETV